MLTVSYVSLYIFYVDGVILNLFFLILQLYVLYLFYISLVVVKSGFGKWYAR